MLRRARGAAGSGGRQTTQLLVVLVFAIAIVLAYNWSTFSSYAFQSSPDSNNNQQAGIPSLLPPVAKTASSQQQQQSYYRVIDKEAFPQTSGAHCSLSTMNDKAWRTMQCSYKNLCFNPSHNRFEFHQLVGEVALPDAVDLTGQGAAQFSPHIVPLTALPVPRREPAPLVSGGTGKEVFILVGPIGAVSGLPLDQFLRDGVFAWWLLAQHAVWGGDGKDGDDIVLRPVAEGSASSSLSPQQQEWFNLVFPRSGGLLVLAGGNDAVSTPICLPRSVGGLGMMTDHCLAPDHDLHAQLKYDMQIAVESVPCSTGRGPLFYALRQRILKNSGLMQQPKERKVVLLSREFAHLASSSTLPSLLPAGVQVKVMDENDELSSAKHAIRTFQCVLVFVTRGGSAAVGAMFQPPGSAILLVSDKNDKKMTDFGYWNNLAYVRAVWEENSDKLALAVARETAKSLQLVV